MELSKLRKRRFALAMAMAYILLKKRKGDRKRIWVQPWLGDYQRLTYGFTAVLDPMITGTAEYCKYVRMSTESFNVLLDLVGPLIKKQSTHLRLTLTPKERLSITLSYLAEGIPIKRLSYEYRIGESTAREIIEEVVYAIAKTLIPIFVKLPEGEDEWSEVMTGFSDRWNFPGCIGALDGKHVHIYPPPKSGTFFYNYKEGFSIVLMALVDAEYRFLGVDVGANGKACDSSVWNGSQLKAAVNKSDNGVPQVVPLPNSRLATPPLIIADSGFPLEAGLMRPYAEKNITMEERVFNYRLSRARRVVENAFGILANRWRILLQKMHVSPRKATAIVLCCCALHNFLISRKKTDQLYMVKGLTDEEDDVGEVMLGSWRLDTPLTPLIPTRDRNPTFHAKEVRANLKNYFNNEGKLAWQEKRIGII